MDQSLPAIKAKGRSQRRSAIPPVNQKPAWAVRRNPSALESRLWSALNTDVYDMDLDRFAAGLESVR